MGHQELWGQLLKWVGNVDVRTAYPKWLGQWPLGSRKWSSNANRRTVTPVPVRGLHYGWPVPQTDTEPAKPRGGAYGPNSGGYTDGTKGRLTWVRGASPRASRTHLTVGHQ